MRERARLAAIGLALLVGCASRGGPSTMTPANSTPSTGTPAIALPRLPREAMPGYVVRDSPLDAATVSTDALDPPTLGSVLSGAGFEAGTERRFTAPRKPLTLVVARVLLFRSADGAGAYLAWVRNHGTDLLGSQAQVTGPLDLPGAIAFSHDSCDFCAKDTFEYFAAWTHGPYALTLLVGGPRAGRPAATPLAEELDARVKKGG